MRLTVNGRALELEGELPLPAFLERRGIDARHIAVAINAEVVERTAYGMVTLREDDVVEIVRMVGGG